MSGLIMEVELPNDCFAVLDGDNIRYWMNTVQEVFNGTLLDFSAEFPAEFQKLLDLKLIKAWGWDRV